ncbi:unnamed protein product [Discosporangium mesarthrocarpum]
MLGVTPGSEHPAHKTKGEEEMDLPEVGSTAIFLRRVLFCGRGMCHCLEVTAEGCKNLVLAGVSATLQDEGVVRMKDVGANFFLAEEDLGKNRAEVSQPRAQVLNNLVSVDHETRPLEALPDSFFLPFRVVILSCAAPKQQRRVAALCRSNGSAFYIVETLGVDGFIFCDLGAKHTYRREIGVGKLGDPVDVEFPTLEEAMAAEWASLKDRRKGDIPRPYAVLQSESPALSSLPILPTHRSPPSIALCSAQPSPILTLIPACRPHGGKQATPCWVVCADLVS